jgi:hypothetical protein
LKAIFVLGAAMLGGCLKAILVLGAAIGAKARDQMLLGTYVRRYVRRRMSPNCLRTYVEEMRIVVVAAAAAAAVAVVLSLLLLLMPLLLALKRAFKR